MAEGRWNDAAKTPPIDWTVSAALENVEREGQDFAEVTNLEDAVRSWLTLEPHYQARALLTIERAIPLDGVARSRFAGKTIAALAEQLPAA